MKHATLFAIFGALALQAQTDPGPRKGPAPPVRPIQGLSSSELALFQKGLATFNEVDGVAQGLGPRFNADSCASCHAHPVTGGASPAINPQVAIATKSGALNTLPSFIQSDGPVRVVRPKSVGGVRDLFVVTGRSDAASNCQVQQPDFSDLSDLTFRIPTPTLGLGLVESITDTTLKNNLAANAQRKVQLGIKGRFNTSGNDGTITRYGWKAQNKSLAIFSGEAYNVEMGVTNELFPQERDEDPNCSLSATPESQSDIANGNVGDVELFSLFMRYSAPPPPPQGGPQGRGPMLFDQVGCTMCHTPQFQTGKSSTPALSQKPVLLFSDLALHQMGQGLADGISQGSAQPDEFRTAPLWGLADRIFLLHDGRTKDLLEAIRQHDSPGSEASTATRNFGALSPQDKQALLNYLRTL